MKKFIFTSLMSLFQIGCSYLVFVKLNINGSNYIWLQGSGSILEGTLLTIILVAAVCGWLDEDIWGEFLHKYVSIQTILLLICTAIIFLNLPG